MPRSTAIWASANSSSRMEVGRTKWRRWGLDPWPWLPMESHFSIPSGLETERSRPIIARGRLEEDAVPLLLLLLACSGDGEREAMSGLSVSLLSSSWYPSSSSSSSASSSSTDALRTSDVADARAARASRASDEAKSPVTPAGGVFGIVPAAAAQEAPEFEFEFECCAEDEWGIHVSSVSISSASALTVRRRPSSAIGGGAWSVEVTHGVEAGFGC
mmetsp:Transcript_23555/g.55480  ORF Transcript_23555/g.55480 Transcript_23555/m.55480 type:complete len:216 (-) Transcript_23555:215-862(-)